MVVRFYSSLAAETTLVNTITGASTSMVVASAVGLPTFTPFTMAVDYEGVTEELVDVTNVAGTTLTITRAVDGTSSASHNAGARVRHVSSGRDFADSRAHENSTDSVHGLGAGSNVVGTTTTQTLTNKTINSANIASGALSGTFTGSPTFSGAPVFSGATLNGTYAGTPTFSGAVVLSGTPNISNGATLNGTVAGTPTFSGATVTVTNDLSVGDDVTITGDLTLVGNFSGAGLNGSFHARKATGTTRASTTTSTADPDLVVPVASDSVYEIEGVLFITSADNDAGDIKIALVGPTSSGGRWSSVGPAPASIADPDSVRTVATTLSSAVTERNYGISQDNAVYGLPISGMITTAGTSGNLTVFWAQNVSNATGTTLDAHSWIRITKVG